MPADGGFNRQSKKDLISRIKANIEDDGADQKSTKTASSFSADETNLAESQDSHDIKDNLDGDMDRSWSDPEVSADIETASIKTLQKSVIKTNIKTNKKTIAKTNLKTKSNQTPIDKEENALMNNQEISSGTETINDKSKNTSLRGIIWSLLLFIIFLGLAILSYLYFENIPSREYIGPLTPPVEPLLVDEGILPDFHPRCENVGTDTPEVNAQSYFVFYADNFDVIASKNENEKVSFASIVKLLSSLVALEYYHDMDQELALLEPVDAQGSGLDIEIGETLSVRELLSAALVGSRNDAMYVLAQNYPGGVNSFVEAMNKKARDLGMKDTLIENPIGFDNDKQYSSLRDIAVLSVTAMKNSFISETVSKASVIVTTSYGREEVVDSTNYLLWEVDGVIGLKSGYTENAGLCLVTYVDDNPDFITIVLNSEDRYEESKTLINWVRENYRCE
ncbi:D-alanyl-D-alanine carboxypeptidase [Candidatus Dojkabacteria bacterium]|nr:D-alanyl-D-alanine carboxypeptidase [Candidatus Dojkabacteria bacterium]